MESIKEKALDVLARKERRFIEMSLDLWNHPELAFEEHHASRVLADELEEEGFRVERGMAGLPTAFVATAGEGKPTIGFLAEYDALPALSNEALPRQKPVVKGGPGHGCGHNLLGTGSLAAALAVRDALRDAGVSGTVKVFGTPAEEVLAGKVFMTRAKVFEGLDATLTWHPDFRNLALYESCLALLSVKFQFRGRTCHIPSRPEVGRNALDAVELMNVAVNMRRKHLLPGSTVEYVVTRGGDFPNVIPDFAEVWYFIRAPELAQLERTFAEVQNAAQGAAIATGTEMVQKMLTGCYGYLPNRAMAELLFENFEAVGPPRFDEKERAFARELQKSFPSPKEEVLNEEITLLGDIVGLYSQDDGDLSWLCPLGLTRTSTWVVGTPAHTWQATAAGGMSIGQKGMMKAAQVLALTALDLYTKPEALERVCKEFKERTRGFTYRCLVPDDVKPMEPQERPPHGPLNIRSVDSGAGLR